MTSPGTTEPSILAAGGVVWRRRRGMREFLVVHRPRYDDWTLPKGKLEEGEKFSAAAAREVEEETGSRAERIAKLGSVAYRPSATQAKVVRYWLFAHSSGTFSPNSEVDEVRWLGTTDTLQLLSYRRDRRVLGWGATLAESPQASRVHVVRHAHAGSREAWTKPDEIRPLSESGRIQAQSVAEALTASPVGRVLSSSYDRCIQTVEPLAKAIRESVRRESRLSEGARTKDLDEMLARLEGKTAVVCSHGAEIHRLLEAAARAGALLNPGLPFDTPKGGVWHLEMTAGRITSGTYQPRPA